MTGFLPTPTNLSPCQPSILPGVWFPVVIWTLRGTATRAVITCSTCCSWVFLVGPCCYGCTWLQLKKFTHEVTNFYWCEDYGYKLIKTRWQPWYSNIPYSNTHTASLKRMKWSYTIRPAVSLVFLLTGHEWRYLGTLFLIWKEDKTTVINQVLLWV